MKRVVGFIPDFRPVRVTRLPNMGKLYKPYSDGESPYKSPGNGEASQS